ncbi:MAG: SUMF1/EgtB/PvdO family nonheme iron enzyme [Rhodothermales bacterium]
MMRMFGLTSLTACVLLGLTAGWSERADRRDAAAEETSPGLLQDSIPGTLVTFDMIPVPAGTVTIQTDSGDVQVDVAPFFIGKTEVTWNEYDIFAYRLDLPPERRTQHEDGVSRPSRPYAPPDYGYGHDGYAAICITYRAAQGYAEWLSEKTGKKYRVPTEAEWQLAAQAGMEIGTRLDAEALADVAWFAGNSEDKTQPVASKTPNGLGLYDTLGNVAEWVTGIDGKPYAAGGSFQDEVGAVQLYARAKQARSWNQTDPQIPKSKWWLSDGFFVGFRLVREP